MGPVPSSGYSGLHFDDVMVNFLRLERIQQDLGVPSSGSDITVRMCPPFLEPEATNLAMLATLLKPGTTESKLTI